MTAIDTEIEGLKELRESLLGEETVMWDEVNAIERDLKFLLGNEELRRAVNQGRNSWYDSVLM
jgi:hypothetical protein